MENNDTNSLDNKFPKLSLSLWSIRDLMYKDTASAEELLKSWKISSVEVASFYKLEANVLFDLLSRNKIHVCSIVAPPIRPERNLEFYKNWINLYVPIFKTKKIILQTLPEMFKKPTNQKSEYMYKNIGKLLIEITRSNPTFTFGYHCFPHDFTNRDGCSFFSYFFSEFHIPDNFGLQLDTYWLRMSNVSPDIYKNKPIVSVHLNERDEKGINQKIGTDPNICIKYIKPIVDSKVPIDWILENDSVDQHDSDTGKSIDVMYDCLKSWPSFWKSVVSQSYETVITTTNTEESNLQDAQDEIVIDQFSYENEVYNLEFETAFTEYLFGNNPILSEILPDDSRLTYYVNKRIFKNSKENNLYQMESDFYDLFWPNDTINPQLINLIGDSGSGKSTFIRYFFQFFFLNYDTLIRGIQPSSDVFKRLKNIKKQHLLLYVNLRKDFQRDFEKFFWNELKDRLERLEKFHSIDIEKKGSYSSSEELVVNHIGLISKLKNENNLRKWYISIILDNSDQLDEEFQYRLFGYVSNFLSEDIIHTRHDLPVEDNQNREIWRLIIPIRPETAKAFNIKFGPIKNRVIFNLAPIDQEMLIDKRSLYLFNEVNNSTKNCPVDIYYKKPEQLKMEEEDSALRAQYDVLTPDEIAPGMKERMISANNGLSPLEELSGSVRQVIDNLVSTSARRRIGLVKNISSSKIFSERMRKKLPLYKFYSFQSLLLGKNDVFNNDDPDNQILNIYNMGYNPKSDPHSIFVGPHSIYLLKNNPSWEETKELLSSIGYSQKTIKLCENHFISKEIIRWCLGTYFVDKDIVNGYWSLLKEPAYIDEMALDCARSWNNLDMVEYTNTLIPESIIKRATGSIWFIKEIWTAEQKIRIIPKKFSLEKQVDFINQFQHFLRILNTPSITCVVAKYYVDRMNSIAGYFDGMKPIIERNQAIWDDLLNTLQFILNESVEPGILSPKEEDESSK